MSSFFIESLGRISAAIQPEQARIDEGRKKAVISTALLLFVFWWEFSASDFFVIFDSHSNHLTFILDK
jgi:hypothetical protein